MARTVSQVSAEETDMEIVSKMFGVEELPALLRQRLLYDPVLYNLVHLVVAQYRANKGLEFELEEARADARLAESRAERLRADDRVHWNGHGPGY